MIRFVVLLRGINVSGQKLIKMDRLRNLLESNGFERVTTYIQSGNVGLTAAESNTCEEIERQIEDLLLSHFGFQVDVLVRKQVEIQTIINHKPFSDEQLANEELRCTISFVKNLPFDFVVPQFLEKEQLHFFARIGSELMSIASPVKRGFTYPNQYLDSKLKLISTNRNWNTLLKLAEL